MSSSIAWLGLGNIGKVMCENLARHGPSKAPVTIWNRTSEKAEELAAGRGELFRVAATVAAAVSSNDIICLCLADDAAVAAVIGQAIEEAPVDGKLFVDFSSIHPDTAAAQSERLRALGAEYLASSVFGGVPLAVERSITLVLAGSAAAIESFSPYTEEVICKNTIKLADKPCQHAATLKLIGNFMRLSMIEVLCEGSAAAEKLGLPHDTLQEFAGLFFSASQAGQLKQLRSGAYCGAAGKATATIAMAVKENSHLQDLVRRNGAELHALDVITRHVDRVRDSRGPASNLLGLYGSVREAAGLPFEIPERSGCGEEK
ncbi:hypothetical protein CDD83_10292 [Cordyceps sp. RAO-2017]|nr:hypothetical protein CDD83_10292 [Cordyceps sp. RAO-2017]